MIRDNRQWHEQYDIIREGYTIEKVDITDLDMRDIKFAHRHWKKGHVGTILFRAVDGAMLNFRPTNPPKFHRTPLGLKYW